MTVKFVKTKNTVTLEIPTSSKKMQPSSEFGKATFTIEGKSCALSFYQSVNLIQKAGFNDYLFLPFRDETNGKETYGGGKYLDLKIPEGNELVINFNHSYQPCGAYNAYDYNCPIVPKEIYYPSKLKLE